jgi:hypothetical protein
MFGLGLGICILFAVMAIASTVKRPPIEDKKGIKITDKEQAALNLYELLRTIPKNLFKFHNVLPTKKVRVIWCLALSCGLLTLYTPNLFNTWWWYALNIFLVFCCILAINSAYNSKIIQPEVFLNIGFIDFIAECNKNKRILFIFFFVMALSFYAFFVIGPLITIEYYPIHSKWILFFILFCISLLMTIWISLRNVVKDPIVAKSKARARWKEVFEKMSLKSIPILLEYKEYDNITYLEFEKPSSIKLTELLGTIGQQSLRGCIEGSNAVLTFAFDEDEAGGKNVSKYADGKFCILESKSQDMPSPNEIGKVDEKVHIINFASMSRALQGNYISPMFVLDDTMDNGEILFGHYLEQNSLADTKTLNKILGFGEVLQCITTFDYDSNYVFFGDLESAKDFGDDEIIIPDKILEHMQNKGVDNIEQYLLKNSQEFYFEDCFENILPKQLSSPRIIWKSRKEYEHYVFIAFMTKGGNVAADFLPYAEKLQNITNSECLLLQPHIKNNAIAPNIFLMLKSIDGAMINNNIMTLYQDDQNTRVVTALVSKALLVAKLPSLPFISAREITSDESNGKMWKLSFSLTSLDLEILRKKQAVLKQSLGVDYFRIEQKGEFTNMFLGASPKECIFPDLTQTQKIIALDLEQAFKDSKIIGADGSLPKLINYSQFEKNPNVKILDVEIPPGISNDDLSKSKDMLQKATRNIYFEYDKFAKVGAGVLRIITCKTDPFPAKAIYDYKNSLELCSGHKIPFGVAPTGEIVSYDFKNSPHLIVSGKSGAGKSNLAMILVEGMILAGWDVYVADPEKGAADFKFATDYLRGIATSLDDAVGMCEWVLHETHRRRNLNSEYGASSIDDLPEEVKARKNLKPIVLLVDEFNTLIARDVPPKSDGSMEMEEIRNKILDENAKRIKIASIMGELSAVSRSARVIGMMCAQGLKVADLDGIPKSGTLKTNSARIYLGNGTSGERMGALGDLDGMPKPTPPVPMGRGVYKPAMNESPTLVQTFFDSEGTDNMLEKLQEFSFKREKTDYFAFIPKDKNDTHITEIKTQVEIGDIDLSSLDLENAKDTEISLDFENIDNE